MISCKRCKQEVEESNVYKWTYLAWVAKRKASYCSKKCCKEHNNFCQKEHPRKEYKETDDNPKRVKIIIWILFILLIIVRIARVNGGF